MVFRCKKAVRGELATWNFAFGVLYGVSLGLPVGQTKPTAIKSAFCCTSVSQIVLQKASDNLDVRATQNEYDKYLTKTFIS